MNLTLSTSKELVQQARDYARRHGTTLNNLIREFLERLVRSGENGDAAQYFLSLTDRIHGDLKGWQWNREELYER